MVQGQQKALVKSIANTNISHHSGLDWRQRAQLQPVKKQSKVQYTHTVRMIVATLLHVLTSPQDGTGRYRYWWKDTILHMFVTVLPLLQIMSLVQYPVHRSAIMWDVDGTLVESTQLAFIATNEVCFANADSHIVAHDKDKPVMKVLEAQGYSPVSVEDYKFGCRYTTPERFNVHIGGVQAIGRPEGAELGEIFDKTYVARVSAETAGLFPVHFLSPQGRVIKCRLRR